MRTIHVVSATLIMVYCSFITGRIVERYSRDASGSFIVAPDQRPLVATVILDGVRDGNLEGRMHGEPRFFVGEEMVIAQSGSFSVPVGSFFVNTVSVVVPEGMAFVASKRGTKYHRVDSAAGSDIAPENRLYFRTESEAVSAGFSAAK